MRVFRFNLGDSHMTEDTNPNLVDEKNSHERFENLQEPFTLTGIAWALASGVLGKIAADAWGRLFGNNDLSDLSEHSLRQIAAIVRAAIREEALRQVRNGVQSVQRLMHDYSVLKDPQLLVQLDALCITAFENARSYGFEANQSFQALASCRLSIIREFRNLKPTPENLQLLKDEALGIIRIMTDFFNQYRDFQNARIVVREEIRFHATSPVLEWIVFQDGNQLKEFSTLQKDAAEQFAAIKRGKVQDESWATVFGDNWGDVMQKWTDIKDKAT